MLLGLLDFKFVFLGGLIGCRRLFEQRNTVIFFEEGFYIRFLVWICKTDTIQNGTLVVGLPHLKLGSFLSILSKCFEFDFGQPGLELFRDRLVEDRLLLKGNMVLHLLQL